MKLYEGMFLVDAGRLAKDWDGTEKEIVSLLEKHGGQTRQVHRYDERKLAYPVKRARRGGYLLAYFDAPQEGLEELRRDLELSEVVLRYLLLKVDSGEVPEAPMLGNVEPGVVAEESAEDDGERGRRRPRVAEEPEVGGDEEDESEVGSEEEER